MAARLNPRHDEKTREKIQASQLINRLNKNALGALGDKEMTSGQIRSAEILLRKVLPDLSAVDWDGKLEGNVTFNTYYQDKPRGAGQS